MIINTENVISITEANQNFSKAIKLTDENGVTYIYRRNKPAYMLTNLEENPQIEMTDDEKILFVGKRILNKYIDAFKELAK